MTMMLLGETLAIDLTIPSGGPYYGPWMRAGGNKGIGAIETFYVSAASAFSLEMETKSSDQIDSSFVSLGAATTISSTTPGIFKYDASGAKDLVRYKINSLGLGTAYMHFQFSQPLWSPN